MSRQNDATSLFYGEGTLLPLNRFKGGLEVAENGRFPSDFVAVLDFRGSFFDGDQCVGHNIKMGLGV
jgi:hypothetical protein